jgi:DNA-binding transcriptional LysR family regulator
VREPELAELRALCAALDMGSISRAARLLHVSQPALSKRLRGLEAVAGAELLQRSTRGVTPTQAGANLAGAARRLLADADALDAVLRDVRDRTAPVRLAASPTVAELWLPDAIVDFEARHDRHLAIELTTANSTLVRQMVREGRTDLGLAAIDPCRPCDDPVTETVIWENEVLVAVPVGHPWTAAAEIEPEEFARTPIIRSDPGANSSRVVDAALERIGLTQVTPLAEIGSTPAAIAVALARRAPVLLPALPAPGQRRCELVIRRVRGVSFARQFALLMACCLEDLAPAARTFTRHLLGVGDKRLAAAKP